MGELIFFDDEDHEYHETKKVEKDTDSKNEDWSFLDDDDWFDPNEFYKNELPSWSELWSNDASVYSNLHNIVSRLVLLPDYNFLAPILCSISFQPTRVARCLPVLLCHGKPGSGKSTFTYLAGVLRNVDKPFSAVDTFSSVRNMLELRRYGSIEFKDREREGAILCWDNFDAKKIREDPKIYSMLLCGYHIRSGQVSIAEQGGKVISFNTFCPKILSSIDPLHSMPEFSELHRRLWVIPHKKYEEFTDSEKQELDCQKFFDNKLEFESINWKGIEQVFFNYWDRSNCKKYVEYRHYLTNVNTKKDFDIPSALEGSRWDISVDPIVTGVLIGAFESPQQGIYHLAEYYERINSSKARHMGVAIEYLQAFVNTELKLADKTDEARTCYGLEGLSRDDAIDTAKLKAYLERLSKAGKIQESPTATKISEWMDYLGFELTTKGWERI